MAKRGTLYRCHISSFLIGGGPETEGTEAVWRQNLHFVGNRKLYSGEQVEMFVTISRSLAPITVDTAIRFDILEEDVILDDKVGSVCCGLAVQKDSDF